MNLWQVEFSADGQDNPRDPSDWMHMPKTLQWVATKGTSIDDVKEVLRASLIGPMASLKVNLHEAKFCGEVFVDKQ